MSRSYYGTPMRSNVPHRLEDKMRNNEAAGTNMPQTGEFDTPRRIQKNGGRSMAMIARCSFDGLRSGTMRGTSNREGQHQCPGSV